MPYEMRGPEHFWRLLARDGGVMDALERESVERGIPIVGPSLAALLSVLVRATGSRRVLELGTANGYSTIFLARALPEGGRVTTIEWDAAMAAEARANLELAGADSDVEVMVGDALALMEGMEDGSFDLIFMDIDKEMYPAALPHCVRLLRPGGLLVCDNVAFASAGDFTGRLAAHPLLETSFIYGTFHNHSPDEDAVSLSVRRAG